MGERTQSTGTSNARGRIEVLNVHRVYYSVVCCTMHQTSVLVCIVLYMFHLNDYQCAHLLL